MVTTDDPRTEAWIRTARMHGMSKDAWRRYQPGGSWRYSVEEPGLKANMSDVHAAIGRVQLRHLDEWQRRRAEIAARYALGLANLPGLELPAVPPHGRHAWHLYVVRVKPEFGLHRDELAEKLSERGIGISVHFIPLHHMPRFRRAAITPSSGLPGADAVFEEILSLPMHQALSDPDVDLVVQTLSELHATSRVQEARR
jgi:perosamine synthetase